VKSEISALIHHILNDDQDDAPTPAQIVTALLASLDVTRVGSSYLVTLAYTSSDSTQAAVIANAFVDEYMGMQASTKLDTTRRENLLLSARLEDLRKQVTKAQQDVQAFKVKNDLLATGTVTLTEQSVQEMNDQLAVAEKDVSAQEAHLTAAKIALSNGGSGESLDQVLQSASVQNLRMRLTDASAKYAGLRSSFGDSHPDVISAQQEREAIAGLLQAEVGRTIASMRSNLDAAKANRDRVEANLTQVRSVLAKNSQALVELGDLQQNAEALAALYASFVTRLKETGNTEGLEQINARVVSPASVPLAPSSPKPVLNMALGLTLGLGFAVAAVLLAEVLDTSLSNGEDLERELGVTALPFIPSLATIADRAELRGRVSPADFVMKHPFSGFAEALRALRAAVFVSSVRKIPKVIAITSALPGEGKTTTATCLGRVLGMAGFRTVVVDCDLRRRGIDITFKERPKVGLLELLEGDFELHQALAQDGSGAWFMSASARPNSYTPKDLFGTEEMKKLLTALRNTFDIVILDTPPVLALADTRILAPQADAVVMLARWRKTPKKAIEGAMRALLAADAVVAGVALTRVDQRKVAAEGYGDVSGVYYSSIRKYYTS
jgi:capsular exopolysaccharide synthesis family protein